MNNEQSKKKISAENPMQKKSTVAQKGNSKNSIRNMETNNSLFDALMDENFQPNSIFEDIEVPIPRQPDNFGPQTAPDALNSNDTLAFDEICQKTQKPLNKPISKAVDKNKSITGIEDVSPEKKYEIPKEVEASISKSQKNLTENVVSKIKNNEEIEKAIGITYKTLKSAIINNENVTDIKKRKQKKKKYPQKFSQELCGIQSIKNGVVYTTSGKYVKILEVLPINYDKLSINQKAKVTSAFASLFHNSQNYFHIKCIVDKNNSSGLVNTIKDACNDEFKRKGISDKLLECAEDEIQKIRFLSEQDSLSYRYFICYEYEGNDTEFKNIWLELESQKNAIIDTLNSAFHSVVDVPYESSTLETGEILHYFFNRNTCRKESLIDRITRINNDVTLYNLSTGKEKSPSDTDYIATKGVKFINSKLILEDGRYKMYMALTPNGHPLKAYPNWLSYFSSFGAGTEIDVHIKKLPHNFTEAALDQYTLISGVSAYNMTSNPSKQAEKISKVKNNSYIVNRLKQNEDLFEVLIVITIADDTAQGLLAKKNLINKTLRRSDFHTEDSDYQLMKFYKTCIPITDYDQDLFKRNKRNYLTSSLKTLYMFTSYSFYDPKGTLLGLNTLNNSLVSQDFFNTQIFSNANASIFGGSGSGKTYTTSILARSMRLTGKRISLICPIKAHEYKRGCEAIGGQYVVIGPGSPNRYNIMEITPEEMIDQSVFTEDFSVNTGSLLSQKIATIITWIQLLPTAGTMTTDEISLVNTRLLAIYERFGINEDNDSIWEDKEQRQLKYMPVIGDMYDDFMEYKELHHICKKLEIFVSGSCRNMNGQTNIDLTNYYTVYDVNEANMPKELLSPFLFIVVILCYGNAKMSRLIKDVIIIEEVWKLLYQETSAEIISDIAKTIRGYAGSLITVTQNIFEYLKYPSSRTILSNSDTKFIMKLKEEEICNIAPILNLNEDDQNNIVSFHRGEGLLLASGKKITVAVKASEKEDREFTTDPDKIRQYMLEENQNY